jgi:tagatose-1,6-bisphosphate aldolase
MIISFSALRRPGADALVVRCLAKAAEAMLLDQAFGYPFILVLA